MYPPYLANHRGFLLPLRKPERISSNACPNVEGFEGSQLLTLVEEIVPFVNHSSIVKVLKSMEMIVWHKDLLSPVVFHLDDTVTPLVPRLLPPFVKRFLVMGMVCYVFFGHCLLVPEIPCIGRVHLR